MNELAGAWCQRMQRPSFRERPFIPTWTPSWARSGAAVTYVRQTGNKFALLLRVGAGLSGCRSRDLRQGDIHRPFLSGKHVISTYVKEAPLSIGFDWLDINWSDGPDQLSVFVYAGEDVIHAESLPDDGDLSASQVPSAPRRFELFLPDLAEGAYRVEINCGNDVVFSGIGSAQNYLWLLDSVFLADHAMYGMARNPAPFSRRQGG